MKTSPAASTDASGAARFWAACLFCVLSFKLACALAGHPATWSDEAVYVEPAVNYVQNGVYASPGLARQLAAHGVEGLDRHSSLSVPLAGYARVPVYELFGTGQVGRRIADWLFLVFATAAMFLALRPWCPAETTVFCCLIFDLHKYVGFDRGRPDVLSTAFGLLAFAVFSKWLRPADGSVAKPAAWPAFLAGFLIGLSGLTHQFGGVFWAFIIVAMVATQAAGILGRAGLIRWLFVFGLGGLAGLCVWLPQICADPQAWEHQFNYMLRIKQHLDKSFYRSLVEQTQDTVFRNPLVFLALAAGLAVARKNLLPANPRVVMIFCLVVLTIWRCTAFEPYEYYYSIFFWSALCLLLGWLTGDLIAFLNNRLLGQRAGWVKNAGFALVILPGLFSLYPALNEAFLLPWVKTRDNTRLLLASEISRQDRVLATPMFYFDVPGTNKSVWHWAETLDFKNYDVVVTSVSSKQAVQVYQHMDQWSDWLTTAQAKDFLENYELAANFTPPPDTNSLLAEINGCVSVVAKKLGLASHQEPHLNGCYIYRNRHPAPRIPDQPGPDSATTN
jgi:hypothetical protein